MTVEEVQLGDIVSISGGGTPSKAKPEYFTGTIPWVSPKDMKVWELFTSQDKITEEAVTNSTAKIIQPGAVLVVIRSGVLKHSLPIAINRVPVTVNQDIKALRCHDKIVPEFLARYLQANASRIIANVRGTTADNIPTESLRQIRIPLPPVSEQKRIAAILDQAEALRAKRRAAIKLLDELTQSIFLDMFAHLLNQPEQHTVGQVADVQGGLQVTTKRKGLPLEVPYLRVANVFRGYLWLGEVKSIRATEAEVTRTTLQKDDLLLVEGHGNANEIGRGALWDGSILGCVHQNHIIRVRFDTTQVEPQFACDYLNSRLGRRHLLRAGKTTSGLNTISVSDVRSTPIPKPPLPLQRRYVAFVNGIASQREPMAKSLSAIDHIFSSLQHRAFRGEL